MATVPNPPPSRVSPSGPLNGAGITPGALLRSDLVVTATGATTQREFGNTLEEIKSNMSDTLAPFSLRPELDNCNPNRTYRAKSAFVITSATQGVDVEIQISRDDFSTATAKVTSFSSSGTRQVALAYEFDSADIPGFVEGDTLKARVMISAEGDTAGRVDSNDDGSAYAELIEVL